nr:DUF4405 domain-containing protein [uncultured Devosia sp.]
MKPLFLLRLVLDFVAAGLLLAALAYNLMGNLVHEIIGSAMFALLIGHNLFNRRWYGTVFKGRPEPRTLITKGLNLSLLVSMLTLLITSVTISQAVFIFLPISSTVTARQIHTMVGYLALLIVAVHLGLHWTMIMGVVRHLLKVTKESRLRTIMLRLIAAGIAASGIHSLVAVNVSSKLLMQFSMEFWDFQNATVAFFLHHAAIIGLGAVIGHYTLHLVQTRRRKLA